MASWRAAYASILPSSVLDNLDADGRGAGMLLRFQAGASCWVAESDAGVIGFLLADFDHTDPVVEGEWYVYALYVHPSAAGCGAGSALMEAAESGRSLVRLSAFTENASARRFYEKRGYEKYAEGAYPVAGVPYPITYYQRRLQP